MNLVRRRWSDIGALLTDNSARLSEIPGWEQLFAAGRRNFMRARGPFTRTLVPNTLLGGTQGGVQRRKERRHRGPKLRMTSPAGRLEPDCLD